MIVCPIDGWPPNLCECRCLTGVSSVCAGISRWLQAPARIDLAGGWSDTPPISYEMGGEVANLAVLVQGKRPIGAKVRLSPVSPGVTQG
jgi:hypothetical protein